jgi:hypothetical protein
MQLEFHQLDRRWEHLRVRHPQRQRRREISVLHFVTRKQFDEWLARPSRTPAETAQRSDLRVLLESNQQPTEPRRRPRWH